MNTVKKNLTTASINLGIGILLIALAVFSMSFTSGSLSRGIRFSQLSFKDAQHQAKYRKKPLFIFIGSHTCMESKRMDENFKNKEISMFYNKNFYSNKFETESLGNFVKASVKWGVKSYPTYLFFDEDGKLISKEEGYKNHSQTLAMAQKSLEIINTKKQENTPSNEMEELTGDKAPLIDVSTQE